MVALATYRAACERWPGTPITLRKVRSGDYRVNFRDGNETTRYYTDSLEDAVKTAVEMTRKRAL